VSSGPPYSRGSEPSIQLPPGALPEGWSPRPTFRQWWHSNKVWITAATVMVAVLVVVWLIDNVPAVSVSHSYSEIVRTADHWTSLPVPGNSTLHVAVVQAPLLCGSIGPGIPFLPNDTGLVFLDSWTIGTGTTFSATYSDPNGTPIVVWASLGGTTCWDSNASGSFVFSAPGTALPAEMNFMTPVPTTIYVNATYSYLAPLAVLF